MSDLNLKERIQEDMKNAMRAKAVQHLGVIRLMLAAIKQYEVDKRAVADDAIVMGILNTMLKQRRDSIAQYQLAKRQDLVDQEEFEVELIQSYLPAPLSDAEVTQLIAAAIAFTGATSVKDMGKVMTELKAKTQGRADMATVGNLVKQQLA
jgi:uncharacterized protein YqeY